METADNVTGKYEDCWDGTKQPTIYVWNINKIFCVASLNPHTKAQTFKKVALVKCLFRILFVKLYSYYYAHQLLSYSILIFSTHMILYIITLTVKKIIIKSLKVSSM